MLEVIQVTRCFGRRVALEQVSFQAARGDIVGLLGPNGAGKTTLLRLAACYLQPTQGVIRLNGVDSFRESLVFRSRMGYLPERCPLYDDMTVGEYLLYRARIKGFPFVKARIRSRELAEQLGLGEMRDRLIGTLSLGCRRRTGLADAVLHDPRLLLLDDPIANVDTVECERMAASVVNAARHATVLISGHALSQLGELCTRFLVLRAGHLVADVPRADLLASAGGARLAMEVSGAAEAALKRVSNLFPGGAAADVRLLPDGWWQVSWLTRQTGAVRDAVAMEVARQGWRLRSIELVTPALESRLADLVSGRAGATGSAGAKGDA